MRNKVAKKLRSIINPDGNSTNKRVYRRAKKQYSKLPKHARQDYIKGIQNFYEEYREKTSEQYRGTLAEGEQ